MGHEQVHRAYREVLRARSVPHHRLLDDRWTGLLRFRWRIDRNHPLAVGAGWFTLHGEEVPRGTSYGAPRRPPQRVVPPEIVAELVRRGREGVPVIPGSSLKGAIRQVYELLTPSCAPFPPVGCKARPSDRDPQLCPACSLFGAAGFGGRLAFGEAEPADDWKRRLAVRKVPAAWQSRRGEEGTVRVYDQRKTLTLAGQPASEPERTWTIWDDFESTVRAVNASREELGLLFASLGLTASSPMLRLGGKKYNGFGAADVVLRGSVQFHPKRETLDQAKAQAWAEELAKEALSAPPRHAAWSELHRIMSRS